MIKMIVVENHLMKYLKKMKSNKHMVSNIIHIISFNFFIFLKSLLLLILYSLDN
jgi:hypothetical protein